MTNGGSCLEKWQVKIPTIQTKMNFMITMLKQIIPGMRRLHNHGYSHGDLKPENICARPSADGSYKFTLIDLGMCSKLLRPNSDTSQKYFRGNYIFCNAEQITNKRPTAIDDLYSLLCVAYMFIFNTLPWLKKIEQLSIKNPRINMYDISYFSKFRVKFQKELDDQLIQTS